MVVPRCYGHVTRSVAECAGISDLATVIRLATPSDVPEIARIHVQTWQAAYRGHMPDAYLDALAPSQRVPLWTRAVVDPTVVVLVAVVEETAEATLAGFCSLGAARDDDATSQVGEVTAIYVEPRRWRSGVGADLMAAALAAATRLNFSELTLWVLAGNVAARRFYERHGFDADGRSKVEQRAAFTLDEVRYRRALPTAGEP